MKNKWICVNDKLPSIPGDCYLVVCVNLLSRVVTTRKGLFIGNKFRCRKYDLITHWMPAPELPSEEEINECVGKAK